MSRKVLQVYDWREIAKHLLFAVAMGVLGAAGSILLCLCANASSDIFFAHTWLLFLLPVFGLVTLYIYHRAGIPLDITGEKVDADMMQDKRVSPWLAPGILAGTSISLLGGASVGKEAGALQIGASLGNTVGRLFKLRSVRKDDDSPADGYAASLGMAATFSALFFSPLGSAALVFEKTQYKRSILKHIPTVLIACFIAAAITSYVGIGDKITQTTFPELTWQVIGQCLIIGVIAAVLGYAFRSGIGYIQSLTKQISKNYYVWVVVGGIIFVAVVSLCGWQQFCGTGGTMLPEAFNGTQPDFAFAIKALLTMIALGFWFKGGEIMPTFTIGALLGAALTLITGADMGMSAAICMMAFFTAFEGCPIASFLMGCEIFGWETAPMMFIAVACSALVTRGVVSLGPVPLRRLIEERADHRHLRRRNRHHVRH